MPEQARLAALASYRVLDTSPEPQFDEITAMAARLFDAPISLVSLVDDHRQWFKSRVGLEACSTPRDIAFCTHALMLEPHGVLIVEDSHQDPRFAQNPLALADPFVRFYVGALLTDSAGHGLGTLCVIDQKPRPAPSAEQVAQLKVLAALVVARLEKRRAERSGMEADRLLGMIETISGVGHWRVDLTSNTIYWSDEVYRIYGRDPQSFAPGPDNWMALIHPDDREMLQSALAAARRGEERPMHQLRIVRGDGQVRHCQGRLTREVDASGRSVGLFGVLEDVTDRQAAVEALRRSQARYKLLAASMADTVTRLAFDGASQYVSPAIETLTGFSAADINGKNALDLVHDQDRWLVAAALERLAKGEDMATVRHRIVHRLGHTVWVETSLRLALDEDDRPKDVVAVLRDITDRKGLEDQLQASEARSRKILANAHQAIVTMDGQGAVTGWNRFAEQTFGWSSAEILGRPLVDFIIPEDLRKAHNEGMRRFMDTGASAVIDRRIEVPALRKNGEPFTIELAISAEQGPDGWSFTALMHDISARKAQFALFETAFHNAAVGMALVSPQGRFNRVNEAYCGLLGYSSEELLALDFQAITHPDDLDKDLEHLGRLAQGRIDSYHMDKRYFHKDGRTVWVHLSVSMVSNADGSPKHFIAQVQDLTARVEAQDALERQTEHLASMAVQLASARDLAEAAARAKAEFLANMSHELRTPLNGVIGFSRLLAEEELSDSARRKADRIRSAGETLNALINDVLDFSKLEAGGVELESAPFNFDDFVADTLAIVEPQADERGVILKSIGPLVGWVAGDQLRLRQVLLNLLSNAVKFTKDGQVAVEVAAIAEGASHLRLILKVIDEGLGIAPAAIGRLFNRFSQADDSITRTFGGTGLGLAICREIVELMGGRIGVDSTLGQGSTFWLELVLHTASPLAQRREDRQAGTFKGRVLLVDDVELNRELASELLRRRGCEVDLACDGAEAVQAVAVQSYDLVLMDLHMPIMDGVTATNQIRGQGLACGPIVALTASSAEAQITASRAAGMVGHLLKPINERDLERILAEHLATGTALCGDDLKPTAPDVPGDLEAAARAAFVASMGSSLAVKLATLLMSQLEGRFASDDQAVLESEGHMIAGSAGILGFNRLGEAGRKLEVACADGVDFALATAVARREAAEARGALTQWLTELCALETAVEVEL